MKLPALSDPFWIKLVGMVAGPDPVAPDMLAYSGSHYVRGNLASLGLTPGVAYTISMDVRNAGSIPMQFAGGPTPSGDGNWGDVVKVSIPAGVRTTVQIPFVMRADLNGLMVKDNQANQQPWSLGAVTIAQAGDVVPAPAPVPAPTPAPAPIPAPAAAVGQGDQSAYLQSCIDNCAPAPEGIYEFAQTLRMPRHGDKLHSNGRLPPRQQARNYGAILHYTGADAAVTVGESQHYISNVQISGVRIEAPNAKACIRAFNPATSVFRDLALIGPGAGGACLHVSGGIQSSFENIDLCGMGVPEFIPHGDFSLRADGIVFENGTDENGLSTTYTAHRLTTVYAHQCARGIVNYSGLATIDGQTVLEDNQIALYIGDTGRTMIDGAYWESNGTPIWMGDHSYLSMVNAEIGSGNAAYFIDAGRFLQISIIGGFLKGPAKLLSPRAQPYAEGSHAAIYGTALPLGLDIGLAQIVGPDMRGAGR